MKVPKEFLDKFKRKKDEKIVAEKAYIAGYKAARLEILEAAGQLGIGVLLLKYVMEMGKEKK